MDETHGRDEFTYDFQRCLSFISYASTCYLWNLHDRITWTFAYWPSWYNEMRDIYFLIWSLGVFLLKAKKRQLSFTFNHTSPIQRIIHEYIWTHVAIFWHFELDQTSLPFKKCHDHRVLWSSTMQIHQWVHHKWFIRSTPSL